MNLQAVVTKQDKRWRVSERKCPSFLREFAIGAASIAAFKELDEGYDTIVTKDRSRPGEALEGLTASADQCFRKYAGGHVNGRRGYR